MASIVYVRQPDSRALAWATTSGQTLGFQHCSLSNLILLFISTGSLDMGTKQKKSIQFIVVSDPTNATSTNSLQKAHSHAARIAHARVRLERTAGYNARKSYKADVSVEDQGRHKSKSGPAPRLQLQLRSVPSLLGSLSADRRDPFNSFVTGLSHIECFLLDHCRPLLPRSPNCMRLTFYADAQVVVPTLNIQCRNLTNLGESAERMLREWVRLALTDTVVLQGILLAACRHLIERGYQAWKFEELAAGYKVRCVRDVIDAIGRKDPDMDVTFAKIFTLANDEVRLLMVGEGGRKLTIEHRSGLGIWICSDGM